MDGPKRIVVIGGSAGAVDALTQIVHAFPPGFSGAVVIVMHVRSGSVSVLPQILDRSGTLPVAHVRDGEAMKPGHIYVAPPDRHVVVAGSTLQLTAGPRENGVRPSVDVLFRSAAATRGPDVVGVVLSGMLGDGAAGLAAIKLQGGTVVVQDPADADFAGMPEAALRAVEPDHVVPMVLMPKLLVMLVDEQLVDEHGSVDTTNDSPVASAARAVEEQVELYGRLAKRASEQGARLVASHFEERRIELSQHAETVRRRC